MSTFTAVGPAFDLDGPLPVAPRHSLLNVAGVVVERDATRVLNGVNLYSYPAGCPNTWEPCLEGTFRNKSVDTEWPLPRFDSFVVYQGVECSTIGGPPEDLMDRIEKVLDATLSAGVEKALAAGVTSSSNPFFGDSNVDLLVSGPVNPRVGVSYLEEAIGTTCRQGMIHLTPAIVAALPAPFMEEGTLLTANGTPVVSGMGYQDVDTTELTTPGATEDWAFATGPVRVYLGPVVARSAKESIDRSLNVLEYFAERYVLAVWDTVLQAAILVDWAT